MYKILCTLAILSSITACGGGGGEGTPNQNEGFIGNGLYVNTDDLAVMVVDSDRSANNLALGDFANNAVYFVDSATTSEFQMQTKGLTYADLSTFLSNDDLVMTADFDIDTVTLTAVVDGVNLIYSMDKTEASLAISDLVGTHTNLDDGSTWTINTDGSFVVNGVCTIEGRLERNGDYYNVDSAVATSCLPSSFNGIYSGVFLTVNHSGQVYIAGLLGNDDGLLWGSAPKS